MDTKYKESKQKKEKKPVKGLNIHQKLHAVMAEAGKVVKEDKKVNNLYKFVSHDAVTDMIRPLLVKHGVLAIPSIIAHSQDGNTTSCNVAITFTNIDNPSESVSISSFGYGCDGQDKGPGKSFSYAVKMGYLKMFALGTGEKDNEAESIKAERALTPSEFPPSVKGKMRELKFGAKEAADFVKQFPSPTVWKDVENSLDKNIALNGVKA